MIWSKAVRGMWILLTVFWVAQGLSSAQEVFPSRAIRIIVPNPPGGVADLHARQISEAMQKF